MSKNAGICKNMEETYKLVYFNKRGGGEIVRLVFITADVGFQDDRLETEEWLQVKSDMPMKTLPCLEITREGNTRTYCQSGAIAKYLARKFGLYSNDADDNFIVEEMYDSVGDVRSAFVQIQFCNDEKAENKMREKLVKETIPKFSSFFNLRKSEFGENGYIIGSKLTLADLAVFNMVDCCVEMGIESLWKPYPALLEHRQVVMRNNNISKWLQTRPNTKL